MLYVIDFEDGKHKTNQQVANLLDGESMYQPVEIEGNMDDEAFESFKVYMSYITSDDKIIVFMENTDGPSFGNDHVLDWVRENANVYAYIARTI